MEFEWDEDKNKANIRKHGFDFADGHELFSGRHLFVVAADLQEDYLEERWLGIGIIQGEIVLVVFTERQPRVIRFISLRNANRREQRIYEKAIQDAMGPH